MTKLRLAAMTIPSLAIYLGLAIAGAGGAQRFFSYPPLIAVTVVTIALGVVALFGEAHIGSGVREDRSNRWAIAALTTLGLIDAYLPAYTDRIDFLTFGGETVRWLGFFLYAVGGALRLAPVFVLGRRFSGLVAIQPGHRLVTTGLYGVIRHPSYLGLFVLTLGWGLVFRSGVGVAIAVLMLIVLLARIAAEERLLGETFGTEYEAYRARTWRLVPYVY
jgi:protein-S-isoprenylcysteine O-methyltransferase Ste14